MVVSKFVRFGVPTRLMVLTLAILTAGAFVTLGLSGCAKTSTQAPPAEKAMQQDPNSLHGSGGRYLIDPDAQMRWSYSSLPDPAPSVKPNYLLKSFLFDVGASSLNSEARGTLGDLTEMLKSKPEVSVLCLGLCDGNKEKVNAANLGMSRAAAARKYLLDHGIAKTRVEMATFGASMAQAPPEETIGQRLDRKVEIWLLNE
ncbi:MAG: OmpA family protein [Candidatus Eisenbacteria bacterium]|uniref:OmpA family protein n=1 Tax=Eiseniibacteriota bacterium TaxID=2212470 RepID=A0A956SF69_UNCEI|nr:OmpA family protein [Candidatus Eisenbacteria bacterium]MCB9463805.1 OmpA family protein [Candidatus Eisenbacteria bacterium]